VREIEIIKEKRLVVCTYESMEATVGQIRHGRGAFRAGPTNDIRLMRDIGSARAIKMRFHALGNGGGHDSPLRSDLVLGILTVETRPAGGEDAARGQPGHVLVTGAIKHLTTLERFRRLAGSAKHENDEQQESDAHRRRVRVKRSFLEPGVGTLSRPTASQIDSTRKQKKKKIIIIK